MAIIEFLIEHFTYLAVFVLLFISGIGVPLPEEPVLLLGGFVAAEGFTNVWITIVVALAGVIAGDNAGYVLGRDHGKRFLLSLEKSLRIPKKKVDKELKFFRRHPLKAIFLMRFLPGLKIFGPALAGYTLIPWWKYQVVNFLAAAIYAPLMILLGWYFSSSIERVLFDVKLVKKLLLFCILAVITIVLVKRMLVKK